jgi:hypothetical protein
MMGEDRKRRVRVGRLTSVGRIAEEIGRVYGQARQESLDSVTAYRLATILSLMAKALEASEIEQRLTELEETLAGRERAPFKPKVVSFAERKHDEQQSSS